MSESCEHRLILDLDSQLFCEICGSYEADKKSFPSGNSRVWGEVSSFEE